MNLNDKISSESKMNLKEKMNSDSWMYSNDRMNQDSMPRSSMMNKKRKYGNNINRMGRDSMISISYLTKHLENYYSNLK